LAYRVFLVSRKLWHYFYDHKIIVVIKAPLKDIMIWGGPIFSVSLR
jgi:hypothetical protein